MALMTDAWPWRAAFTAVMSVTSSRSGRSRPPVSREKLRQLARAQVGQGDLADGRILKEIVCTGSTLKPGTEYHHFHGQPQARVTGKKPRKIAGTAVALNGADFPSFRVHVQSNDYSSRR